MTKTYCDSCGIEEVKKYQQSTTSLESFSHIATIPGMGHVMVNIILCPGCATDLQHGIEQGGRVRWEPKK